jgi:hypothetical protein
MTLNITGSTIEVQSGFTLSVNTLKFASAMTALGVGIPLWGANCPAGTLSAPYTWIRVVVPDGSVCYVPAYK